VTFANGVVKLSDHEMPAGQNAIIRRGHFIAWLAILFVASLPFVNPWVRGDGVGYYAYVRSLLIRHDLNFEQDWLHANPSFVEGRTDGHGHILESQYTSTGHLDDHFSVGPSLLWSPFLLAAHGVVLAVDELGYSIPADGFSRPYRVAMAVSTACYGFGALLLAFDLARHYFREVLAFLATLGIWFASSLPVYMYFNPSWSHAHSAFAVSLFLWYWHRTRARRSWSQWATLAAISGLMMNIYYPNSVFLVVPGWEAVAGYRRAFQSKQQGDGQLLSNVGAHLLYGTILIITLTPTFVTRWIIYGNPFESGYPLLNSWSWGSPKILQVLFSADHGMLTWTPVLMAAVAGLILFSSRDISFAGGLMLAFVVYLYCIASYVNWDGLSSFGNRFFVSFTPVFIIGLAALLERVANLWRNSEESAAVLAGGIAVLIFWNFGLIFQWGTLMIPTRGAIRWSVAMQQQFVVVPTRVANALSLYFFDRRLMMQEIENEDKTQQHLQR
jgi:hypothetical protein